ncbi:MAG: hypothetical protein U1F44_00615 [Coriobacteriia bacterium]|nr:hypothetical protein [Coriobacteriia bacterium]
MTSSTYIYTYIAFALIYAVSSVTLVLKTIGASERISKAGKTAAVDGHPILELAREYIGHGQRLVDYVQLATLLPLAYIVGSIFLGSAILRNQDWSGIANTLWVIITVLAMAASIILAVRGTREVHALSKIDTDKAIADERASNAAHKLVGRLGISTTLLVLATVFTTLNLWSVVSSLDTLLAFDYVL